jgi:hypothetical protein
MLQKIFVLMVITITIKDFIKLCYRIHLKFDDLVYLFCTRIEFGKINKTSETNIELYNELVFWDIYCITRRWELLSSRP